MENWIHPPIIDTELFCDASDFAWGGVFETKHTGGAWSETEKEYHTNEKQLMAIFYTLKLFKFELQGKHIKKFSENTTAVAVINKMGTCKNHALNKRAQQNWSFCQQFRLWISASHIPGKENVAADFESRREYKDAEWMLNPKIFNEAQNILSFQPKIDCFATRINAQLSEYSSRRPDPEATFIATFTVNWRPYLCYLFTPFSLLPGVLQKIQVEQVEALIAAPYWPTQPWFSQILSLAAQKSLIYKPSTTNLILPQDPKANHLLAEKLSLMVSVLSGKNIGN